MCRVRAVKFWNSKRGYEGRSRAQIRAECAVLHVPLLSGLSPQAHLRDLGELLIAVRPLRH